LNRHCPGKFIHPTQLAETIFWRSRSHRKQGVGNVIGGGALSASVDDDFGVTAEVFD
jgi:hypothetical protein